MTYEEVFERYNKMKRLSNDKDNIEALLKQYKAYEIPVRSIHQDDYHNDEEVDPQYIYKLFHISDKHALNKIIDARYKNQGDDTYPTVTELTYRSLIGRHNSGRGVSIVLESKDGKKVSNFKVYGQAQKLSELLLCYIPFETMTEDIQSSDFQYFLDCLDGNGFL
ncbi:hypothetical protein J9174_10530 [Macrococcoides canis]|uniref:hypothetical protein n=1 Tax=Macrococcoides canis TaxID=1855823 RepID=UPI001AEC444D|nr:hypothetical protein [Macrococcus canis]QTQ07816.1 hypothetical protein J9174_10530 [Macrococcus canis]